MEGDDSASAPRALASPGRFRCGLPAWAFPGWRGVFFDNRPSALASYARVFDAVEGNTTFYAVPDAATVDGWAEALRGQDLRISFKLPRTVTHERQPSVNDFHAFLSVIEPLRAHLGPLLVQFPARIDLRELQRRERLFERLAGRWAFTLEVRHPAFFEHDGAAARALADLLDRHGGSRAVLDASALYAGDPLHPAVVEARHEKPLLPVPRLDDDRERFVRLVFHPDGASNTTAVERWAPVCAAELRRGRDVTLTVHCPDNAVCPPLARRLHERLRNEPDMAALVPPLPPWPVPDQAGLF